MTVQLFDRQPDRPERLRYYPRQLVKAEDLRVEQEYHRQRQRRHNRYLHGWGVVCGFEVRADPQPTKPWQLSIGPGYALTPPGDEIAGEKGCFDVATCLLESQDPCAFSRPCPPITRRARAIRKLYLAVRHVECDARPVKVAPVGCGCDDAECEYSRILDGYEFCCLDSLPGTHGTPGYGTEALCAGDVVFPCPGTPSDPWVVLATLTLPPSTTPLTASDIDATTDRRLLYSTSMLQELARGLCSPPRPTPATPP
jgi:hypothetical protein